MRIVNLDGCTLEQRSTGYALSPSLEGYAFEFLLEFRRKAEVCVRLKKARFIRPSDMSYVRLTKSNGRFHQSIQHRLQIECRAADDLEHVGGCGLLLQRLAQLVEQARVLDGNDGLLGKIADQLDLRVRERTDFLAKEIERPNQLVVLEQWNGDQSPDTPQFKASCLCQRGVVESRLSLHVGNLNSLLRHSHTCEPRSWGGMEHRIEPPVFDK